MGYPEHPQTIIVRNKYYPKGLREIDSWSYYQKMKGPILSQTMGRDLMFWVMVDENNPVVLRRGQETNFIRLNNSNYDQLVHGRVISIHSAMKRSDDIAIIDVDSNDFEEAKIAAIETYEFALTKIPFIYRAEIRYTGKTGFHIFCHLSSTILIDSARFLLKKLLSASPLARKYTIEHRRTFGTANLDLSPNKYRGNFVTLNSLSIWGLRCITVDHGDVLRFDPHRATIMPAKRD
jgi:hypothetical protein